MDPAERKTLWLFKVITGSLIFLILSSLFYLSNLQKVQPPLIKLASSQIKPLEKEQQIAIEKLPWFSEQFSKSFLKEKINYVNYWAEWCEPCLKEIPELKKLSKQFSFINLIFVNVDSKENQGKAEQFWNNNVIDIKSFYINNSNSIFQYTRGLPYHQVYDKNSKLFLHFTKILDRTSIELQQILTQKNEQP